jgi:phosphomannomutase
MGMILNLLAAEGCTLSELVKRLPNYTIVKTKFQAEANVLPRWFDAMSQRWPEAAVNRVDGLRLDWPNRWLHARPSNTEPIVRVIAEAPTAAEAESMCNQARELL